MSFVSKNLQQTTNAMTFIKGATLFFLGASCVLFLARAFEVVPIASNAVMFIKSIFLTASGNNASATGIILEGNGGNAWFKGDITIDSLTGAGALGTNASGKIIALSATGLYDYISGFALSGPTGAIGPTGPQGSVGATGPTGPTGFLQAGITGATPFFYNNARVTNNTNIFNTGGNVGIGTLSPAVKFVVNQHNSNDLVRFTHSLGNMTMGGSNGIGNGANNLILQTSSNSNTFVMAGDKPITPTGGYFAITNRLSGTTHNTVYNSMDSRGRLEISIHTGTDTRDDGVNINTPLQNNALRILNGGNVGIGYNIPSEKLQVNGNILINEPYTIIIPKDASYGKILVSSDTGAASWKGLGITANYVSVSDCNGSCAPVVIASTNTSYACFLRGFRVNNNQAGCSISTAGTNRLLTPYSQGADNITCERMCLTKPGY